VSLSLKQIFKQKREKDHLEDPGVEGMIILRRIFRKRNVRAWNGSMWLRIETGGALVNALMTLRVPQNAAYFLIS
jgi:hypothetical protein